MRVRLGALARQHEGEQRRRHEGEQTGMDEIGPAPADGLDQRLGQRPADRRGEPAGESQRGDRRAGAGAKNAAERGEGGIVKRRGDRGAEQYPDPKIGSGMAGSRQQDQTKGSQQGADRHDPVPAMPIDQASDRRRNQPGDQQSQRKPSHGEARRPAVIRRDQRHGQHSRIEQRAPGQNLSDSEHQNGTPGTVQDVAVWFRH